MAEDVNANIRIGVDTSDAITSVKNLQRQIALLNAQIATGSKTSAANAAKLNQQLIDGVNATGRFAASMTTIKSSTEAFTTALEKNKLSMGQYFRYSMGATRTFGRFFGKEFDTIQKVAIERTKDLQTQFISLGRNASGALQAIKVRPLSLDMQDLTTKTMIAAQKMQLMNQLMKQGSTQLLNWGKNTQWAGRQLMVGFTIPLTMFAAAATKSFMEIEKQILKIQRVYGDFSTTVEETKAMTDQIRTLAQEYTKYGVAVTDTLNLAADAAAAGKTGQELLSQISEATRLAVLGNVEQTQALETTMSITNAFGTAADQLAGKIDFLNAVENQSVTSIEDLTEAIPKAGPVVQQLGGDVEDLAFFLTAMKEGGINASEGANALKSGLASLINPTGKAKEMLAGFGINIEKIVESNKGDIKGLVIDFASALDTLDPLNRARAIEQLFGKFQFSRLSTLFQNVIKDGSQAQRVLELSNATTQELAILSKRELAKIEQSTTYKFEKAFADFQAAIAPVGEEFLKLITPVIEFGTKLLQQFNNMDAGVKQFVVGLTAVLGVVFPALLMTVGLFANGIANILKLVSAVSMVFKRTSGDAGILGNQFEYMTQAEIQAAAAAASLDQVHSKLRQTFTAEKAAVDALTTAYQRNIAAQKGAVTGGASTRKPKPAKGYAKGVVSVPGPKGAGDVVPAMLSPGESIIPAEMTKKYAPLINGMVAGNIPGFNGGVFNLFTNATGFLSQGTNKELTATLPGSGVDPRALAAEIRGIGGGGGTFASPIVRQIISEMGLATTEDDIRRVMRGPEGAGIRKLATDITENVAGAVAEYGGKVTDDQLSEIAAKEVRKAARGTKFAAAAKTVMTRKTTVADSTSGNRKGLIEGVPWYGAGATQRARDVVLAQELSGDASFNADGLVRAHLTKMQKMSAADIREYLRVNNLPESPSVTRLLGKKDRQEAAAKKKRSTAGSRRTATKPSQTKTFSGKIVQSGNQYYSVDPETGKRTRVKDEIGRAAIAAEEKRQARNAAQRERRAQARTAAASAPAPKKQGIGSRIASGVRGMGGMGLGMGVSMAGGAMAMIPGLQGVGSALAMVGPLFMMLPAPIAGVVAALGLMAFGVYSVIQAQEEQKKKAIELANSMSMTTEKMQGIAEVTGQVGATELRRANQEALLAGPQSERSKAFGESFLQSDPGKGIIADIATQKAAGVNGGNIASNIGAQLAAAVAQGVLTTEQAKSIAVNLGTELKDYRIATNIEATLTRILGPNGENLAEDPLQVTMAITRETNDRARQSATSAAQGQANPVLQTGTATGVGLIAAAGATAIATGWTGVGLIAAGAMAIAGIVQTVTSWNDVQTKNVKLTAAAAQNYANAYSQGIGMVDVINQQYDQKVAELETSLELAKTDKERRDIQQEIATLEGNRTFALQTQQSANQQLVQDLIKYKDVMDTGTFNSALMGNVENLYKDDAAALAVAKSSMESINALETNTGNQKTFQATLQMQLASGELDPYTAQTILAAAASNESFSSNYNALISATGDAQSILLLQMLGTLEANEGTISTVIAAVIRNPEQVDAYIQSMSILRGIEANGGIAIDINTPTGQQQLQDTVSLIDKLNKEDEITIDVIQRVTGSKEIAKALKNNKDFMKLPKAKRIAYAATYTATMNLEGDPAMQTAYRNWVSTQAAGADASFAAFARYLAGLSAAATTETTTDGDTTDTTPETTGGGGGQKEDKKLAKYNKALDKRQKALAVISLLEAEINKKYEERAKALQRIAELNAKVVQGQKDQLAVSTALSSGDIAAAARAVQEARENAAAQSAKNQTDALEEARKRELDAITFAGQTRATLELEIARLELLIAKREYKLATTKPKKKSSGPSGPKDPDPNPQPDTTPSGSGIGGGAGRGGGGGGGFRFLASGGKVAYFATGGKPRGSDIVPAMLTPGEFVVKRPAVQGFGVKNLEAINNGQSLSGSVYNYSVTVNAGGNANADDIAKAVITKIKQVESHRIKGNIR